MPRDIDASTFSNVFAIRKQSFGQEIAIDHWKDRTQAGSGAQDFGICAR
ncbi:hypothetical protein [Planctomicrobium piriforme]|nr:hypothetical protein [Planctomicrobium piriforme]